MRPRALLVVLLLAALTLTAVDAREPSPFDPLRAGVDALLGPLHRTAGGAASAVGRTAAAVGDLTDRSELQELRADNARLRRELAEAEESARRLAELDALLQLSGSGGYTSVPGRVVGAGSALGFSRTVTVDLGSHDGVRAGLTVVSGAGLVGRTVRVGRSTCVVLLLDDPVFGVGARLAREGTLGLARGDGRGRLVYTQVEGGPVAVGEVLLTTGSDTFVPGVPVGRVLSVGGTDGGPTAAAQVEPFVRTASLDLVAVVTEPPRWTPRVPLPLPPSAPAP